ncbi:MAG: 4-(cytidine 5'-diphospho)-2-C-methyl-D-erythritol kinase [Gammaproteobacteria bacterium]|nr:4-(cytidine 5'-diphospho)-2-C-methyl-D-erythritol kinase [Gammaproteobacteria bacterium]
MNTPWPAPAKLNRFLRITGRRADGYHELQTLFHLLDHGDSLQVELRTDGGLSREGAIPGIAAGEEDLCLAAARLLQQSTGSPLGARLLLEKQLPVGGGLGGGSSDAATTLVALNALWATGLSVAQLAQLGLQLGADVPLFVHGYSAWGEGVGERLQPQRLEPAWFVVLCPPVQVSTAAVFSDPELTRDSPPITIREPRQVPVGNDLEAVVRRRYPAVATTLDWLRGHGPAALTGTGACVFLPVQDPDQAAAILEARPAGTGGFVARGVDESPLHRRLREWRDNGA